MYWHEGAECCQPAKMAEASVKLVLDRWTQIIAEQHDGFELFDPCADFIQAAREQMLQHKRPGRKPKPQQTSGSSGAAQAEGSEVPAPQASAKAELTLHRKVLRATSVARAEHEPVGGSRLGTQQFAQAQYQQQPRQDQQQRQHLAAHNRPDSDDQQRRSTEQSVRHGFGPAPTYAPGSVGFAAAAYAAVPPMPAGAGPEPQHQQQEDQQQGGSHGRIRRTGRGTQEGQAVQTATACCLLSLQRTAQVKICGKLKTSYAATVWET
jgi:hypothetical protein